MIEIAVKPKGFLKRLKAYDSYLDLEWMPGSGGMPGHWCIMDTARLVAVFPRKTAPCITKFTKVYNRIYHIPAMHPLNGAIIKEIKQRRLQNWQTEKAYKQDYKKQVEEGDARRERDEQYNLKELSTDINDLKRFGVVMPGFKEISRHTGKRSIYGS